MEEEYEEENDGDTSTDLPLIPDEPDIQDSKRKTSIFKFYSQTPGGKTWNLSFVEKTFLVLVYRDF